MNDRLKRLLNLRFRISTQLYIGIGGAVLLTIAASLVGWFSFNRVGDVQSRVNEGSVPEMAAAFGVARYGGTLVAAGPSLTASETVEEFAGVSANIAEARQEFENQLALVEMTGEGQRFEGIRSHAGTLIRNIESIEEGMRERFDLAERTDTLRLELAGLRSQLDAILIPAIDDQLFYTMTGYQELGAPPEPRGVHFSEAEFVRFRYLAEIQADVNIATQLLASAFTLSDASLIEPLQERFESSASHIERNLAALEESFAPCRAGPGLRTPAGIRDRGAERLRPAFPGVDPRRASGGPAGEQQRHRRCSRPAGERASGRGATERAGSHPGLRPGGLDRPYIVAGD